MLRLLRSLTDNGVKKDTRYTTTSLSGLRISSTSSGFRFI